MFVLSQSVKRYRVLFKFEQKSIYYFEFTLWSKITMASYVHIRTKTDTRSPCQPDGFILYPMKLAGWKSQKWFLEMLKNPICSKI